MTLGEKIKVSMIEAGIKTNRDLANRLGCWPQEVGFWINGKRNPSIETRKKLAKILNKPEDFFFELSDQLKSHEEIFERFDNVVFLKEIGGVRCGNFQLLVDSENGEFLVHVQNRNVLPAKSQKMTLEEVQNKFFVFYAEGDSMSPIILDGDSLIIEKIENNQFENGDIVIFADSDNHAVCKRIYKIKNGIILKSENNNKEMYPDLELKGAELRDNRVLGKVVYIGRVPSKNSLN